MLGHVFGQAFTNSFVHDSVEPGSHLWTISVPDCLNEQIA
jgi:hypothetical protein